MIPLAKETFHLQSVSEKDFWEQLDDMTCGQSINPEFSYSTSFYGNFDNVFGGRKKGNRFSVYLYRPITSGFRTEILAKGIVKNHSKQSLHINISYELPFWSFALFCIVLCFPVLMIISNIGDVFGWSATVFILFTYALVVWSNFNGLQKEMARQMKLMQKKE